MTTTISIVPMDSFEFDIEQLSLQENKVLPQLPPEVIDMIIDYLHKDKPALRCCALTCRAWVNSARYHLFNDIALKLPAFAPVIILDWVHPFFSNVSPNRMSLIRTLHLQGTPRRHGMDMALVLSIARSLPQLQKLKLHVVYGLSTIINPEVVCTSVTELLVFDIYPSNEAELSDFLIRFPNVKHLSLTRVFCLRLSEDGAFAIPPPSLMSLETVDLYGCAELCFFISNIRQSSPTHPLRCLIVKVPSPWLASRIGSGLFHLAPSLHRFWLDIPIRIAHILQLIDFSTFYELQILHLHAVEIAAWSGYFSNILVQLPAPHLLRQLTLGIPSSNVSGDWGLLNRVLSRFNRLERLTIAVGRGLDKSAHDDRLRLSKEHVLRTGLEPWDSRGVLCISFD